MQHRSFQILCVGNWLITAYLLLWVKWDKFIAYALRFWAVEEDMVYIWQASKFRTNAKIVHISQAKIKCTVIQPNSYTTESKIIVFVCNHDNILMLLKCD